NCLGMAAAIKALLEIAHMHAEIMDKFTETVSALFRLSGMDLVPQVPGEESAAPTPALDDEGEPCLDRLPRVAAEQNAGRMFEHAAILLVVGMPAPVAPHPECVERRE